jgi:hypothetical protein
VVPPPCGAASRSFDDADRVTDNSYLIRVREGLPTNWTRSPSFNIIRPQVVQLCRTVLGSTDDKNLSRKTHSAVCGVPT